MLTEIFSIKNVKNWRDPDDISSDKHLLPSAFCPLRNQESSQKSRRKVMSLSAKIWGWIELKVEKNSTNKNDGNTLQLSFILTLVNMN